METEITISEKAATYTLKVLRAWLQHAVLQPDERVLVEEVITALDEADRIVIE